MRGGSKRGRSGDASPRLRAMATSTGMVKCVGSGGAHLRFFLGSANRCLFGSRRRKLHAHETSSGAGLPSRIQRMASDYGGLLDGLEQRGHSGSALCPTKDQSRKVTSSDEVGDMLARIRRGESSLGCFLRIPSIRTAGVPLSEKRSPPAHGGLRHRWRGFWRSRDQRHFKKSSTQR